MTPSRDIDRLLAIMAALRTPKTGCPWDLEQNFATIAPYTIEEAYEVADAIERGNLTDLEEELGDLLLQVAFHARMAQEQDAFDFGDVVETLCAKLIRRHPHVFGDEQSRTPEAVKGLWERIKAEEKAARGKHEETGALAGVPVTLPALDSRTEITGQSQQGRLRLERSARGASQNPRRSRRDRSRARQRQVSGGRRSWRSFVRRSQSCASSRCRSGGGIAADQPEIRAAVRFNRSCIGYQRQNADRCHACRNGCPLGRSEGAGMTIGKTVRAATSRLPL